MFQFIWRTLNQLTLCTTPLSKYWQYSTSITQSDYQLKLTLLVQQSRKRNISTEKTVQALDLIHRWRTPPQTYQGEKNLLIPWEPLGKAATSRESGRADGRSSQPLPHYEAPLSTVQSKYDASRISHFKLPNGHTEKVERNRPEWFTLTRQQQVLPQLTK